MSDESLENKPPEKPKRGNPNWVKGGKSPNPGGRSKSEKEVAEMIRARGADIIDGLFRLAKKGNVHAMKELLDRGYGRAKQSIEVTGKDGGPITHIDLRKLTKEQLEVLHAAFLAGARDR